MSWPDGLQLAGGLLELVGLFFVAVGIVETRRAFSDRPGVVQKVARAVAGFVARLTRRRRSIDLQVDDAFHAHSAASARLRVQLGFPGSLEERVQRLQEIAQRHQDRLDDVAELIESESKDRRAEIKTLREALGASERKLEERIREAAANGLTTATVGVAFSFSGVALSTWGGLIA